MLTAVALVAVVCLLIAAATTLAMYRYLDHRLDEQVLAAADRQGGPGPLGPGAARFSGEGTLRAIIAESGAGQGNVIEDGRGPSLLPEALDDDDLERLADVPADGRPHDVRLRGLGEFRVVSRQVSVQVNDGAPEARRRRGRAAGT